MSLDEMLLIEISTIAKNLKTVWKFPGKFIYTLEESGVRCFPSSRGLTTWVSLEWDPEIRVAPVEENSVLDTSLNDPRVARESWGLRSSHRRAVLLATGNAFRSPKREGDSPRSLSSAWVWAPSSVFSSEHGLTQLSLATRGEDWASQGQPKGKADPWSGN